MITREFAAGKWNVNEICDDTIVANDDKGEPVLASSLHRWVYNQLVLALELKEALKDAAHRIESLIGTDCECDNTHEANNTKCCLCEYRELLELARD